MSGLRFLSGKEFRSQQVLWACYLFPGNHLPDPLRPLMAAARQKVSLYFLNAPIKCNWETPEEFISYFAFSCKYQMHNLPERNLLISCHKSWRNLYKASMSLRTLVLLYFCSAFLGMWLSSSRSQNGSCKFYPLLKSWTTRTKSSLITPETKLLKPTSSQTRIRLPSDAYDYFLD